MAQDTPSGSARGAGQPDPELPSSALATPRMLATVVNRSYQLWLQTKARFSPTERQRLFGLTIAIGGVCGLVAVAFHQSCQRSPEAA